MMRKSFGLAAACAILLGVTACGDDDDTASDDAVEEETTTTEAPEEVEEADEVEDAEEVDDAEDTEDDLDAPAAGGDRPEWANEFQTPGEMVATIEAESYQVDVYQVGTATAPKDGMFVDPDTNEPILKEGDEIVFVNYVFTNTSDEAISLGWSLAEVDATYADWQWLQGMDGIVDDALFEEQGLQSDAQAVGSEAPFVWEPGTSFAHAANFAYQPGAAITFEASMTPVDDAGDLDHDRREEASAEATIA